MHRGFFMDLLDEQQYRLKQEGYCGGFAASLLHFRNRNSFLVTYLYTALASQAFFGIDGNRFSILNLIHVYRALLHTFFAPFTFVVIDRYFICHQISLL
jgi:hypothetical protein